MKKFAIGCGIVLMALCVVGGVAGYLAYTKLVKPIAASFTQFARVPELERQVKNTAAFTPPTSGELNEELLGRFLDVQETMQARLGAKMAQLKARYEQFDRARRSERRQPSFSEGVAALKDLAAIIVEAKQAQVDALNHAGFSVREYEWVRDQAFAAIGVAAATFDVKDIQRLAEQAGRGAKTAASEAIGDVPARNRELVQPYVKKLQEWAPLAFFGL
jgi:hypothetical protein